MGIAHPESLFKGYIYGGIVMAPKMGFTHKRIFFNTNSFSNKRNSIAWGHPRAHCLLDINHTNIVNLTNRFHVATCLFSNRSQMTSKCGKN